MSRFQERDERPLRSVRGSFEGPTDDGSLIVALVGSIEPVRPVLPRGWKTACHTNRLWMIYVENAPPREAYHFEYRCDHEARVEISEYKGVRKSGPLLMAGRPRTGIGGNAQSDAIETGEGETLLVAGFLHVTTANLTSPGVEGGLALMTLNQFARIVSTSGNHAPESQSQTAAYWDALIAGFAAE